ncbi:DUF1771 domain-containing protein [Lachnospiraceae bacterium 29-91]
MSRNYELDRLKVEQDIAFQRKQEAFHDYNLARERANAAHDVMQNAWEERVRTREKMNQEFENRKSAFEHHDSVWENYKHIRDYNNSRIESLKYDADSEHHAMQDCFDRASTEYEYGNKSEAPVLAQEGHEHKERRNELNAEISALAQEVKNAREYAESCAPKVDSSAFESAKNEFKRAKSVHESAQAEFQHLKAERDRLKNTFDSLQVEFLRCKELFQRKLEEIKSNNQRERDQVLDKAKVYGLDRKDAKIVKKNDGTVHVYHSGVGKGDGFGHAHTALDRFGNITYDRNAFSEHGSQNFTDTTLRNGVYSGTFENQPAIIKVSDAGNSNQVQIFYGGKGSPDGPGHNHINIVNDKLQYWRENGKVIYQDDRNIQENNL